MSEKKYQSPGPGLDIDDFGPSRHHRRGSPNIHSAKLGNDEHKNSRFNKGHNLQGGVVGHQHYGAWQEQNNFFQPPPNHGPTEMHGGMPGMMQMGGQHHSASQKPRNQARPHSSSHKTKQRRGGSKMRNRNNMDMRGSMQHPPMMHPMMQSGFPMHPPMPMMPHFDMAGTLGPMASSGFMPTPAGFGTISDTNMTAATTNHNQSHFEETERKNKARIDLLEKKIQAKDQLFEDALASTIATSCACGSGGSDNKSLTTELKKRFLALKSRYEEAEQEIERLTKTVKVVEVEVREDTEPLRAEIQKLKDGHYDLQQINARLEDQFADQRLKIEQLERENSKRQLDEQRYISEISIFEEKIRGLEEHLSVKTFDFDGAQNEIRELREANSGFDMQIQLLQTQLSDASMYKDWYEVKSKEYDDLHVQLSEEQHKVLQKEDEIMSLTDKLTVECETISDLKETITELNVRITELEEELANRPDVKDDSSSSSSSEKEDRSAEVEKWKSKFEKLEKAHERYDSDMESHKRICKSEIEELTTTNQNWEKRIIELKLLLRRNNISLDDSPVKTTQINTTTHITNESKEIKLNISIDDDMEEREKKEKKDKNEKEKEKKDKKSKDKKKKKKASSSDYSCAEYSSDDDDKSSQSDSSDDKKKKKKNKDKKDKKDKKNKKDKKDKHKKTASVAFDESVKHPESPDHSMTRDPSLLMSMSSTTNIHHQQNHSEHLDINVQNPNTKFLSPYAVDEINTRDETIHKMQTIIEDLQCDIEMNLKREEERKQESGILGKIQATVNNTLYKSRYEDSQKKLNAQQFEYGLQLKKLEEENYKKFSELVNTFQVNTEMLEAAKKQQEEGGDKTIKIYMNDVQIEVREKQIFLDRHVIEASDHAKFTVLDEERKLMKKQISKFFKKQILELEANVLAYQDLLMTKELRVRQLEKDLIDANCKNRSKLEIEIQELKLVLKMKLEMIEHLKADKQEDKCEADYYSDDDLTGGKCNKNKLKRRVYKKIEHLNEYIKNEVKPEIHQQYTREIEELMRQHHTEIDKVSKDYETRLRKLKEECRYKIDLKENERIKYERHYHSAKSNIDRKEQEYQGLQTTHLALEKEKNKLSKELTELKEHVQTDLDLLFKQHSAELRNKTEKLRHENKQHDIQIKSQEKEIMLLKSQKVDSKGGNANELHLKQVNLLLKEELSSLSLRYQGIEETLNDKDQIIQEYLDYKQQWNAGKFMALEEQGRQFDAKIASVKAKLKQKKIDVEIRIKAECAKELVNTKSLLKDAEERLYVTEERLADMTLRVEELEMMTSNNSLEVKNVQNRHVVRISQLTTDNKELQKKQLAKIEQLKISYEHQKVKMEEAYLNKIQYLQEHVNMVRQEERIKGENKLEILRVKMEGEIHRLTMMINIYKEKLNRRESENRNLLVQIKLLREKLETIESQYIGQIKSLKEELRVERHEWTIKEQNFNSQIHVLNVNIGEQLTLIESLNVTIVERNSRIQQLLAEIERLKRLIAELEARPARTEIIYKEKEKVVYKERDPMVIVKDPELESDDEFNVEDREEQEETFEVIGTVNAGQSEVVIPRDAK